MEWLVALLILVVPFLLIRYSRHLAARLGLLVFWLACGAGGAWFLAEARKVEKDLETVYTYPLASTPGTHRVPLAPLSQGSMKGVLRGGAQPAGRPELEKAGWSFTDPKIRVTWFEAREHDPAEPDETLLFYVDWWGSGTPPAILEYRVDESRQSWFQGRTVRIGHDGSAKHLLRDHALVFLNLFGGVLLIWGGLWLLVQVLQISMRPKKNASLPAGTEAFGFLLFFILYSLFFT